MLFAGRRHMYRRTEQINTVRTMVCAAPVKKKHTKTIIRVSYRKTREFINPKRSNLPNYFKSLKSQKEEDCKIKHNQSKNIWQTYVTFKFCLWHLYLTSILKWLPLHYQMIMRFIESIIVADAYSRREFARYSRSPTTALTLLRLVELHRFIRGVTPDRSGPVLSQTHLLLHIHTRVT